jgi:hypothetical protein
MIGMTQIRRPDGKFGGSDGKKPATDITRRDIQNAISLVVNDVNVDAKVTLKKPVQVNANVNSAVVHRLSLPEFLVYALAGLSIALVCIVGALYLGARI